MARRRTGKVAQLPRDIREQVNVALRDGKTYASIVELLGSLRYPGFNEENIRAWFKGHQEDDSGYNDWLQEQARLDEMRQKREFALEIVKQNEGATIHEAAHQIAASQLYEVISEFDPENLKTLLMIEPENYAKVVTALARLGKGALEMEKFRDHVRSRKQAMEAVLKKAKVDGPSRETIEDLEAQLKLL